MSTDTTFVHAFAQADGGCDQVVRVIRRREPDVEVPDPLRALSRSPVGAALR